MKTKKFRIQISLILAVVMLFSMSTVAFAAEVPENTAQFGDVLYEDAGMTIFYGNPAEHTSLAEEFETQAAARALQHNYIWVDANSYKNASAKIYASSSNPITYFTVRQESNSAVSQSRVRVERPDGSICYIGSWDGLANYEQANLVISTEVLWNEPFGNDVYTWTSGTLTVNWNVIAGSSGARLNLWAW